MEKFEEQIRESVEVWRGEGEVDREFEEWGYMDTFGATAQEARECVDEVIRRLAAE